MNPSWPAVLCATTNWPIHQNSLSVTSVIKICQAGSCVENMCYGALGELANFALLACIQDQGFDRTYRSDEIQNTKASRTIGHTVRWENNFEIGEAAENGMGTALAVLFRALWSFSSSYSNWYQRLLSNKVSKIYLVLVLLHITQSHDESVHTLPIMYIVVSSFFVKILVVALVVPLPKIQIQPRAAPLPQEWDWEERGDNNIVVYIRIMMIFDFSSRSYRVTSKSNGFGKSRYVSVYQGLIDPEGLRMRFEDSTSFTTPSFTVPIKDRLQSLII